MRSASWILISSGSTGRITRGTRGAFLVADEEPASLLLGALAAAEEEEDGAAVLELGAADDELEGAVDALLGPSSSAESCFFAFLLFSKVWHGMIWCLMIRCVYSIVVVSQIKPFSSLLPLHAALPP